MAETTAAPNNRAVAYRGRKTKGGGMLRERARAKRAMKRGLISTKAAKRHLADLA